MILPEKIRSMMADEPYERDEIGMSGASIFIFRDKVLKVQENDEEAGNEVRMMQLLRGKLPVPHVYACESYEGRLYLLMGRCEGQMACAREYMSHPPALCKLLADGLKRLWSVIFGRNDKVTGYIDLGKMGIADRWCDIAICYRSLSHNFSGKYGEYVDVTCSEYDEMQFFRELGIEPDWEKIRYYILLDELF